MDHLEADRHNSVATRNNRLAAVHSLFAYLALHHPEHAGSIQQLAIPPKRTERNLVTYLTDPEVGALLGACDQTTWTGRRDHAMFALTIQTGLRISELACLTRQNVALGAGANVHTVGKGRKERRTALVPATRAVLKAWLAERPGQPTDPLFPTVTGGRLSRIDPWNESMAEVELHLCSDLAPRHLCGILYDIQRTNHKGATHQEERDAAGRRRLERCLGRRRRRHW